MNKNLLASYPLYRVKFYQAGEVCAILLACQELNHDARRYRRTNDPSHVRPHCMHQENILRIFLQPYFVNDSSGHRYGRDTSRSN